jgi:hypothetical protein
MSQCTRLNALGKVLKNMKGLSNNDLLKMIDNFNLEYNEKKPDFPEVETKSNLRPDILFNLLLAADIDFSKIEGHRLKLKELVSRRNEIVHGKPDIIHEVEYYFAHEKIVSDVMYEIALGIENRLNCSPYA